MDSNFIENFEMKEKARRPIEGFEFKFTSLVNFSRSMKESAYPQIDI